MLQLFSFLHPILTLLITFLFGAIIGSFLNVVIYRYPLMLEHEWNRDAVIQLNLPLFHKKPPNLLTPRSHCPHCKKTLSIWMNIPIFSYLWLRAKCYFCHKKISCRYPLVEILTALFSIAVIFQYGITPHAAALLIFTYVIIVLSFIDFYHQFLPDFLTLSLLWLGLLISTQFIFITPTQAIIGALLGYLFLWLIATSYKLIRKKEGMGLGDCKMLAMIGAWVGPLSLLNVLLLSALLALCITALFILCKKHSRHHPIPYGPFIGIAGWYTLMYGNQFMQWITQWVR